MTTRIERLCPEITSLAAYMGQNVRYYGGDYFMTPCNRSLWNTRIQGRLTPHGAELARQALARMAATVSTSQAHPMAARIDAVAAMLRKGRWRPGYFMEVTTDALDKGDLDRWLGGWNVRISIVGWHTAEVKDHPGSREDAVEAARAGLAELATEATP